MPEPISTAVGTVAGKALGLKPLGFLAAALGSVIAVINKDKASYFKALGMLITGFFTAIVLGGPLTIYVDHTMSSVGFNFDGLQYGILFAVSFCAAVAAPNFVCWLTAAAANPLAVLKRSKPDGSSEK